jgi:hypothetical protein
MSLSNEVFNFSNKSDVKKLLSRTVPNLGFKDLQMGVPARVSVVAPSGTCKTQWILNYIARSSGTFGHIILVHKQDEPLYDYLCNQIGSKNITMYKALALLPSPDALNMPNKAILLILDDVVADKKQEVLENYFIRGRKVGLGITCVYLSQSYYDIPKLIHKNMNYLIILRLSGERKLSKIFRKYSLGIEAKQLPLIYKDATKVKFGFLKVDISGSDNKKFSKNWTEFFKISDSDNDSDSN